MDHSYLFFFFKILVLPRKGVVNIDVILRAWRRKKVADNRYSEAWNKWSYFRSNETRFPKQLCDLRVPRICPFTGALTKLWKRLLASPCLSTVCPYVLPHGTARIPLDEFSWNLISEYFSKNLSRKFMLH